METAVLDGRMETAVATLQEAEVNKDDKKLVEDLLKLLDDGTENVETSPSLSQERLPGMYLWEIVLECSNKLENDEEIRGRNKARCC